MPRPLFALIPTLTLVLAAQAPTLAPLRIGEAPPVDLDLTTAEAALLLPRDNRDATQVEAARQRWIPLVAAVREAPAVRLRLPLGEARVPLLLAAAQALRAQAPGQRLYVAFDPKATPVLDETAWGAVDGGALLPSDLNVDSAAWRAQLAQAQETFPGRPWTLWLPKDPGPQASTLLGDGGRLVVPAGGSSAQLAGLIPTGFVEVEGGVGDLTLRTGPARPAAGPSWMGPGRPAPAEGAP